MRPNLRTEMPTVATWIDSLRDAFGADGINAAIKAGINGAPTFYATENGHTVGTPAREPDPAKTISVADMALNLPPKTQTPADILAHAHRTARHK